MRIQIHQLLHGYENGHQQLAGSITLDQVDSKLVLFQSDLSGPTLVHGFETYVSGYPLKSAPYYALARTWYAQEMSRPGCVWTQTLLIEFADLGKLSSFYFLNRLFERPTAQQYHLYSKPIDVQNGGTGSPQYSDEDLRLKIQISTLLYEEDQKTIFVPANISSQFERIIFDIWSDQWPRLRRNFTFCSGSLSSRTMDNKAYDLQVIPNKLVEHFKRQNTESVILTHETRLSKFIPLLQSPDATTMKNILWLVGADVEGTRKNFLSLLKLIHLLSDSTSIDQVSQVLRRIFPNEDDASVFKTKLYGKKTTTPFKFPEHEILRYLLTEPDKNLTFINLGELDLELRLVQLLSDGGISIERFAELYNSSKPGRISESIWQHISMDDAAALTIISNFPQLALIVLQRNISIATQIQFWHLPTKIQQKALKELSNELNGNEWSIIIDVIIRSESEILTHLLPVIGPKYLPLLIERFSESHRDPIVLQPIITEYYSEFKKYIQNLGDIPLKVMEALLIGLDFHKIQKLELQTETWIRGYDLVRSESKRVNDIFSSCILLSIGFQNKSQGADRLVIKTFETVYTYGRRGQLNSGIWQMINRDDYYNDNEAESVSFWSLFKRKKKDRVPYWDYCESLVRIGANAYARNNWSYQSFILAFSNPEIFERIVDYSLTFEKGEIFMDNFYKQVSHGRIIPSNKQNDILKRIFNE